MITMAALALTALLSGCALAPGGLGLSQAEKFAPRNADPRIGVVRNFGGNHLTCRVRDQTGQPVDLRGRVWHVGRYVRLLTEKDDDLFVTPDAHGNVDHLWYVRPATLPLDFPGAGTLYVYNVRMPSTYVVLLEPGFYTIECIPFHIRFWVLSGRERIDGPWHAGGFAVGNNPFAVYDYRSGRHWGWLLGLNGGDPPRGPGFPNFGVHISVGN